VKVNPPRSYVNMEKLPPINYDLIDTSKYIKTDMDGTRMIPYQSSRGCPHRCKFCINPVTGNQKYRMKSAKKVLDEIEMLIHKYKVNFVNFVDDNFFVNIKRAREICEGLIKRNFNIKWHGECRADYFRPNFVDQKFLDLAVKSGLSILEIGAESGSQRVLDTLGKDITVEQILTSAKMLSKYEIEPSYGFMAGVPGETREEVIATIELAKKIKKICPKTGYVFSVFTPYPKCELTEELLKEPKTLREWMNDSIRKLYAGRFSEKPWHGSKFIQNIAYFSLVGYDIYSDEAMKNYLKNFRCIYLYPEIFFILIARIRMKYLFFGLPIDRFLYGAYKDLRRKRWQKNIVKYQEVAERFI